MNLMKFYNAIIVEDEESNLQLLKHFILKFCLNINIVGEAKNIEDGIKTINETKPDILFMDICLNNDLVFTILDSVDFSEIEIIFITAHNEFAINAFKYNVIDYILKPISIEELVLATNKAIKRIEERIFFENQFKKNISLENNKSSKYLSISSLDKVDVIKKDEIIFCKSDGRYTTFYLKNNKEIVACKNLGEYELMLGKENFFRVHNSYIVNLDFIVNISKKEGFYCIMSNNALIPVSKRRQESLKNFLKQ